MWGQIRDAVSVCGESCCPLPWDLSNEEAVRQQPLLWEAAGTGGCGMRGTSPSEWVG